MHARWGLRHGARWVPGAIVLAGTAVATRTAIVVFLVLLAYNAILLWADADDYRARGDA